MGLSGTRSEILELADKLRPHLLERRFAQLERMGFSAGKSFGDVVSGSRVLTIPLDKQGEIADQLDRRIKRARQTYGELVEAARKALDQASAIEKGWLIAVHVASEEERAQASDSGVDCKRCLRPVACTPADKLLAGMCRSCFQWWVRSGRPDIIRVVPEEEPRTKIKVTP